MATGYLKTVDPTFQPAIWRHTGCRKGYLKNQRQHVLTRIHFR